MELKPGYKQTEVGVIPEDWTLTTLDAVYSFTNGFNSDKSAYGSGTRFINVLEPINISHINAEQIPGRVRVTERQASAYAVRAGDIVLNRTSETDEDLGRIAVYTGIEQVVFGGFVIRGRQKTDTFDPGYSGYALRGQMVRSQIVSLGQGAVRANISQQSLQRVIVVVPPKHEQLAIARALLEIDQHLSNLDQLIAKKRDIRQAAMQELLTGKRRLPGFEGEWEVKKLGDIATIDPENLGGSTKPDYRFNYISLEDVDQGALLGWSEQEFSSAPLRARRRLRQNDLLVSTVRPSLKSHLFFNHNDGQWVCSTGFAILRCDTSLADPNYVYFHLFGDSVSKQIETLLTGSSYPAISSRDVQSLEIALPALPEQLEIAHVLSSMEEELFLLTLRFEKANKVKQGMMQQLLTGKIHLK
jgi:type I restriction enzyme S subunit